VPSARVQLSAPVTTKRIFDMVVLLREDGRGGERGD
jgi:hypothetical protein